MKKNVLWGYLSQFLQYGAALLILPILLTKLSSAELGVWYVFMTISALVTMLDMGFSPTIARNVSYVLGGARNLQKDGYSIVESSGGVDFRLLQSVILVSRRIFGWVALLAAVVLSTCGSWYILAVTSGQVEQHSVLTAWVVFVLAIVINLYFKYYTPLLQGRGLFIGYYKSSAISNITFVAATIVFLEMGMGLVGIAYGFLVSALVGRWLSWRYLYDDEFKRHTFVEITVDTKEIFELLWHNAWRLGLGLLGAFLILRANTLLASAYLGLEITASYALTLQVFAVLQSISMVVFNVQQPKFAQHRVTNEKQKIMKAIRLGIGSSLGPFLVGSIVVIAVGNELIQMIGGQTELLPTLLLAWVALMVMLELIHSLAAGVIITGNRIPFVKPALISGMAIFLFSLAGLKYGGQGVEWLIGVQFLVQLSYNNWKWPWEIYKEFFREEKSTTNSTTRDSN